MVRKCAKHVHGNPLVYRAEIPDTLSIQLGGPPFSWTNQCAPKVQVLSTCSRRETGILNPYCSELKLRPYFDFSDGFMQWLTLSCLRPRGTPRSYHAWNPNILPQKTGEHRRTHQTLRPLSVGHQGISNMWLWAVHGHSWALAPASSSDSSSQLSFGPSWGQWQSQCGQSAWRLLFWHVLTCTDYIRQGIWMLWQPDQRMLLFIAFLSLCSKQIGLRDDFLNHSFSFKGLFVDRKGHG